MKRALLTLAVALVALVAAAPAHAACPAEGAFDPAVPTWESVHGFELGSRPATYDEVRHYLAALDAASPKVVTRNLGRASWAGRPLPYAIVSDPLHLAPERLAQIGRTMRALRGAGLAEEAVERIAATEPAIAHVGASVHGDEPSGTDASMRLLYELAARTDCANLARLNRLLTFVLPVQNPDGHAASRRGNDYGFDLNRDWFARTQPETDAKVALLRRFPPLVFVDAHEQAGDGYFVPPNADPIHHEISWQPLSAVKHTYGPALRSAAEDGGFDSGGQSLYDLFFMGLADAAASTTFGAAAMTFEKGAASPYPERTSEQFAIQDAALTAAAQHKERLLDEWAAQWPHARSQGRRGVLEPNVVQQPGSRLQFPVPEISVFGYFIRADESRADAARLARRLRSFDVRVYRLRRDAAVRAARRYGERRFGRERLPAGSFWIPMGQPQKHWIQALLGENPYAPFPYFYDVSSWSNPLLMGLEGGFVAKRSRLPLELWDGKALGRVRGPGPAWRFKDDSSETVGFIADALGAGARVVRSRKVAAVSGIHRAKLARLARRRDIVMRTFDASPPPRHSVDLRPPKVAILENGQSAGFARFVAERRFGLEVVPIASAEIEPDSLRGFGAVVVAAGDAEPGSLGPAALSELQRYVRGGGRYIGFGRAGLLVGAAAGLTLAREMPPPGDYHVPGASLRMRVNPVEPVAWGFQEEGWLFNDGDPIFVDDPAAGMAVASYPDDDRFFVAGYAEGADALEGTPAALSQEVGDGQSILFSFDPNFRGYTESTMRMYGNALFHPVAGQGAKGGFRVAIRPGLIPLSRPESVIRVPVAGEPVLRAAAAAALLPRGARFTRDLRGVSLRVPTGDEQPWARRVLEELRRRGVEPNLVVL